MKVRPVRARRRCAPLGSVARYVGGLVPRLGPGARVLADLRRTKLHLGDYPSVSVVVAARDEAAAVEVALRSALEQDYPGRLQVIADDDRRLSLL